MKTCPFCAEEIQDAAIVCKHCGRDLSAQTPPTVRQEAPPTKTGLHRGCLLVILLAVGWGLFFGLRACSTSSSPDPGDRDPYSAEQRQAVEIAIDLFVSQGFVKRLEPERSRAYVDLWQWSLIDVEQKAWRGSMLARYMRLKGASVEWVDIHDYQSGKRLAQWTETRGLRVE
ncbi:MAG: hypothetical protein KJ066_19385 [Acidobacteria bacterium]|nr:hypothetical protein [Acidobacteriota bacterium]